MRIQGSRSAVVFSVIIFIIFGGYFVYAASVSTVQPNVFSPAQASR